MFVERQLASTIARQCIHDHGILRAFHLLKQNCGSIFLERSRCDFGDFKIRVNFDFDSAELTDRFEIASKVAESLEVHWGLQSRLENPSRTERIRGGNLQCQNSQLRIKLQSKPANKFLRDTLGYRCIGCQPVKPFIINKEIMRLALPHTE